jgi:hypothetical protein
MLCDRRYLNTSATSRRAGDLSETADAQHFQTHKPQWLGVPGTQSPVEGERAFLVELLARRQANDRPAEAARRIRMEQNPSKLMTRV